MTVEDKERRLHDATTLLASLARDFSGRYLVRLDSFRTGDTEQAFEKLKNAARQFVAAEWAADDARAAHTTARDEALSAKERAETDTVRRIVAWLRKAPIVIGLTHRNMATALENGDWKKEA